MRLHAVRLSTPLLVGVTAAAVLAGGVAGVPLVRELQLESAACPVGYTKYADAEKRDKAAQAALGLAATAPAADERQLERTCVNDKRPESLTELAMKSLQAAVPRLAPVGSVQAGAYGNAVEQRGQMTGEGVRGVSGKGAPYGNGPLIVDDKAYPQVNGLGLGDNSARIDALTYDQGSNRLLAALGSGGIYLSTDLARSWQSIGDRLPTTITGGVGYVPAHDDVPATVVALTGDPTFGSNGYTGLGAYYTTDLDRALAAGRQPTWEKSEGLPDGALGFKVAVDPSNPSVVYAGTSLGLYRSADGGRSFTNTRLPIAATKAGGRPCTGVEDLTDRPDCVLAQMVTDVVVQAPGGTTGAKGGAVVAAVGWRGGNRANPDGSIQAPSNGIYGSDTGAPDTFTKLNNNTVDSPVAFTEQVGIGRIELGAATGPQQDHGYLYAAVQDARLINGGLKGIDLPMEGSQQPKPPRVCDPVLGACPLEGGSVLEGLYVSKDFGKSWVRMADRNAIARNPAAGSSLVGVGTAIGYEPGVQSWYDMWITPDPTQTSPTGAPSRVLFGLEEVWENEFVPGAPKPVDGPTTFKVIGRYFAGSSCQLLTLGTPTCPTNRSPQVSSTTHPDQHAAVFVPVNPADMSAGVHLILGNDGGAYRQTLTPSTADDTKDGDGSAYGVGSGDFDNGHWGRGANTGFDALLPYHAVMAKDGTVYAGLQDNGHMKIDPARDLKRFETYGGDGFFAGVDPDNSKVAYEEYTNGGMHATADGGTTWTTMNPPITNARFSNPFILDPKNAKHILTAGREVVETTDGPATTSGSWAKVFDLGTASRRGDASAKASDADPANAMTAVDLRGNEAYVGFCGNCDTLNKTAPFRNGLATNVGGNQPAKAKTADGWHIAAAKGLPNRYITSVAMDPANPSTVWVTLGGYTRRWLPPGTAGDVNAAVGEGHLFVSRDAGATFTDATMNLPDAPATWVTLRGRQLLVGTDVGAFASDVRGLTKKGFAPLTGVPNVPIGSITLSPRNLDEIVLATNGRGVWTYTFDDSVGSLPPGPPAPPAPTVLGVPVAGPFGFESDTQGWTTATDDPTGNGWQRAPGGHASSYAFTLSPYLDNTTATLTSPPLVHPGGGAAVRFWLKNDTEPGYDGVDVQWSSDGGKSWNAAGSTYTGRNTDYPNFTEVTTTPFTVPAGPVQVRFVFHSDSLVSVPLYTGASVDDVALLK